MAPWTNYHCVLFDLNGGLNHQMTSWDVAPFFGIVNGAPTLLYKRNIVARYTRFFVQNGTLILFANGHTVRAAALLLSGQSTMLTHMRMGGDNVFR